MQLQTNPLALPPVVELETVPFFPQTEFHCGPAALATMLRFQQQSVTPETLAPSVYVPGQQGSYQLELTATARSFGLAAYPLQPLLADILSEIAAGNPVLIMQNLGVSWLPLWHYAVVTGYDLSQNVLILRSGTDKRLVTRFTTFERTWSSAGYWALTITSPEQIPVTAEPHRWVKILEDLALKNHPDPALSGYQQAAIHWPDNPLIYLGQGNLAYANNLTNLAVQSFLRYTELLPESPVGWNNLSYALAKAGCESARQAYQCARKYSEDLLELDSTREDIELMLEKSTEVEVKQCSIPACRTADRNASI